jgi:SAM-dependent methyltransferase
MTTNAALAQSATDLDALKARLKTTWMAGDYDLFSRYMERGARQFYQQLGVAPGMRLLDVACGAGQLAIVAAREGAQATGCDIAENWIEAARARAASEGLSIRFDVGDAEALPYGDAEFDVVTTLVGAMFAPRPGVVAAELTRVCRPGGRIVMANWTPGGFIGKMFKAIAKYIAPNGMPSPALWGDEDTVRERFRAGVADLKLTRRLYPFNYPFGPSAVVEFFRIHYGPMRCAFDSLDVHGQQALRNDLVHLWSQENNAVCEVTTVNAEYLEVIATRG